MISLCSTVQPVNQYIGQAGLEHVLIVSAFQTLGLLVGEHKVTDRVDNASAQGREWNLDI